jgi:peptidoglycan/xylan/chitin deacetylase (PgdA/CDA1 family)
MIEAIRALPRRSARLFRSRLVDRGVILLYHRIAERENDPWGLNVDPGLFAEQMEALSRHGQPLPLAEAVRSLHERRTRDRFISVTFDDGYADNLTVAKPILARLGVPATLFVPTTYVVSGREPWWDLLQRLLLEPSTFAPVVELEIAGQVHRWALGDAARYDEETALRYREWNVEMPPPTLRHFLCTTLHALLRPLPYAEQHQALAALAAQRQAERSELVRHRVLTAEEVRRFVEPGAYDVGSHSATHPMLSRLPVGEQRREVRGSRTRLEEIVGGPVTMFAYPYGGAGSYTAETKQAVIDARYEAAFINRDGAIDNGSDRFELPRFQVKNWDVREFSRHLRKWLRGVS